MKESPFQSRRQFVKTLTYGSVASALGGKTLNQQVFADVGVEFTSSVGKLRIRLEDYPALNEPNGSIRIGLNPLRSNHQPNGTFHPILINRLPNEQLIALSAECTHASCAVRTLSETSGVHICPCHGSRFAIDGRRISGPAPFALETYPSKLRDKNTLEIDVPRLGFTVNGCLETFSNRSLLKLEFPARRSLTYRVLHQSTTDSDWSPARFSTAPAETPSQLEFDGNDTIAALYVSADQDQGFYAVDVKVLNL